MRQSVAVVRRTAKAGVFSSVSDRRDTFRTVKHSAEVFRAREAYNGSNPLDRQVRLCQKALALM